MEISQDENTTDTEEDDLDQEELEIALYSQIHFEENTASDLHEFKNGFNVWYDIKVDGNNKTGFVSNTTTSDVILSKQLKEKYNEELCTSPYLNSTADKSEVQTSVKETLRKNTGKLTSKLDKNATLTQIKDTQSRDRIDRTKPSLAEKLILGLGTESGSEIVISDDDDDDGDNEYVNNDDFGKVHKVKKNGGKFIDAYTDEDNSDTLSDTAESDNSDIMFNIIGGKLPSSSSESEESVDEDDWKISVEDKKIVHKSRYFKPVVCFNCSERGHISKTCPKPKKRTVCSICSETGHSYKTCKEYFCTNCLEMGHTFRRCRLPQHVHNMTCYRCKMVGHESQKCPEQWRQYHLTIEPGHLVKGKCRMNVPLSCYNCGGDDHFGHECEEKRMNLHVRLTSPYISQYRLNTFDKDLVTPDVREDKLEDLERPKKKMKTQGSLIVREKSAFIQFGNKQYSTSDRSNPHLVSSINYSDAGGKKKNKTVNTRFSIGKELQDKIIGNKKGRQDKNSRRKSKKQGKSGQSTEINGHYKNVKERGGFQTAKRNRNQDRAGSTGTYNVNYENNPRGFRTKLKKMFHCDTSNKQHFEDLRITVQNVQSNQSTVNQHKGVYKGHESTPDGRYQKGGKIGKKRNRWKKE